jgi:hypothetical protein
MKHRIPSLALLLAFVACGVLAGATAVRPALADTAEVVPVRGGSYVGQNVYVPPGETVDGDVNVVGGNVRVDGVVHGDVNVVFGSVTVSGVVRGDVNVVGGSVEQLPGSRISGEVNTVGGSITRTIVPLAPQIISLPSPFHPDERLFWHLLWGLVVVLIFLIFPNRVRLALDRVEHHPGLCAATGLLAWVAVIPIFFLLLISIVLWPLIPVEPLALVAGIFLGKAALSLLVGRRLYELANPEHVPSPLLALIIGLALLTAAEMVPVIGLLVMALIWMVGLGAAILSFTHPHVLEAHAGHAAPPPGPPAGGPPISGPPMTPAS